MRAAAPRHHPLWRQLDGEWMCWHCCLYSGHQQRGLQWQQLGAHRSGRSRVPAVVAEAVSLWRCGKPCGTCSPGPPLTCWAASRATLDPPKRLESASAVNAPFCILEWFMDTHNLSHNCQIELGGQQCRVGKSNSSAATQTAFWAFEQPPTGRSRGSCSAGWRLA